MSLQDQVAIVTGASRGIGHGIAMRLADLGMRIVGTATNAESLRKLKSDIEGLDGQCITVVGSITEMATITKIVDSAISNFGQIDLLVNNAGIVHPANGQGKDMLDLTEQEWDAVVSTNLKGAFFCSQAAARHMAKRRTGKIINIASVLSYRVNPPAGILYHVSKGGLLQLTAAMAALLAPYGIIVNGIAPGWIETDLTKDDIATNLGGILEHLIVKHVGQPRDVADLVAYLAGNASGFLVGQTIVIDGGQSLLAATYKY